MFRLAWPLANKGPGKAFSAQPCGSIVTRKGKPLTPWGSVDGPTAALSETDQELLHCSGEGHAKPAYHDGIQLSVLVLFAGMPGWLTWGLSRLAVPSRGHETWRGSYGMLERGPSHRDSINSKLWCSLIEVINFGGQTYHDAALSQM